jgi:uncharacterized membrane protein YraQ (UPF0718 family)
MKSYQKVALYMVASSFIFSMISSFIPDEARLDIDTWFGVMSVVLVIGAGIVLLVNWMKENI